jgi:Fe-S-cluster containining protein
MSSALRIIQQHVQRRAEEIASENPDWPCRKGCDECCRRLASVPLVTREEWQAIASILELLPAETAELIRKRIRDSAHLSRPVVCPMLDTDSGTCLVYEARPVACRAYGFYMERGDVLGCSRIETIAQQAPDVVWGNHVALEERLRTLGNAAELYHWLADGESSENPKISGVDVQPGTAAACTGLLTSADEPA